MIQISPARCSAGEIFCTSRLLTSSTGVANERSVAVDRDHARRDGLNVHANVYPYTRGNNDLASIIPPWARRRPGSDASRAFAIQPSAPE